jgi:hypothetical protein
MEQFCFAKASMGMRVILVTYLSFASDLC